MTFHRLANPSYFIPGGGPLLPGYDLLNDPTTTGGTGIPVAPDPGPKVGGTNDGVYFICDGAVEPANAYNLNRPSKAVAESIDLLDDRFYQSIAVKTGSGFASVGDATRDLNGSTDNIFTGSIAGNADLYFDVADTLGRPIFVNGARVYVTTSSVAIGSGFSAANPLTLTFSATIPSGLSYIVYYTIRSALTDIPVDSFAQKSVDVSLNTRGYRYDDDVVTVSGGGISGATQQHQGDVHTVDLEPYITGTTVRGDMVLRAGNYTIGGANHWTEGTHVRSSRLANNPKITLAVGRASDVFLSAAAGVAFHDVSLATASILGYQFVAQTDFVYDSVSGATVEAGALALSGTLTTQTHRLSGLTFVDNASLTTGLAGLFVGGAAALDMNDCNITETPAAAFGVPHLFFDTYTGTAHIRNCRFGSADDWCNALKINFCNDVNGSITFDNCDFTYLGTTPAWAAEIIDSFGVVFRNCRFYSEIGTVIRVENSGVTFEDCIFASGANTTATNPQMIIGEGYISGSSTLPFKIIRCVAVIGAANIRVGASAPVRPIIFLGGRGTAAHPGPVQVDTFKIEMQTGALGVHNYTTVVLSGSATPEGSVFDNITIDMKSNVPATGALDQFGTAFFSGGGHVVELIGPTIASPAGKSRVRARNLQVLNAGAPAVAVGRSVICVAHADVDGMTLDGSALGAGSYSLQLIQYSACCDITDVRIFPTAGLISTSSTALIMTLNNPVVSGGGEVSIRGLRYHHRSSNAAPAGSLFSIGRDSLIRDAIVLVNTAITLGTGSSHGLVALEGDRARLQDSTFIVDGLVSSGGFNRSLLVTNSKDLTITGNFFRWQNTAGDAMALLDTADRSIVTGNRFVTTALTVPVVSASVTSAGSVNDMVPEAADFGVHLTDIMNIVGHTSPNTIPRLF